MNLGLDAPLDVDIFPSLADILFDHVFIVALAEVVADRWFDSDHDGVDLLLMLQDAFGVDQIAPRLVVVIEVLFGLLLLFLLHLG